MLCTRLKRHSGKGVNTVSEFVFIQKIPSFEIAKHRIMKILRTTNTDFKKLLTSSILFLVLSFSGCSGNDNTSDTNKTDGVTTSAKKENTEIDNAAKDVCNCFADFEKSISSEGKKIMTESANKNAALGIEQLNETDRQLFSTKGKEAYDCTKSLEKKYTFLTNYTDEQEKLYNEALKRNCSEFVVAVMTSK